MSSDPFPQPGSSPEPEPIAPTPLPPTPPLGGGDGVPSPFAAGQTADASLPPNVAAGLAVLILIIGGIVFLVLEKRNQFVRFWAMQSVYFGAAWFITSIVIGIAATIITHIFWPLGKLVSLFGALVSLAFLVLWVIMLIQSFSGKEWTVPILGPMARQQLNKPPGM